MTDDALCLPSHVQFNPEAELAREAKDARLAELQSENEALRQNIGRMEAAQVGGRWWDDGGAAGERYQVERGT